MLLTGDRKLTTGQINGIGVCAKLPIGLMRIVGVSQELFQGLRLMSH